MMGVPQPRLALAAGFSNGGDGSSDPAYQLFLSQVMSDGRSWYPNPHERIACFGVHGEYNPAPRYRDPVSLTGAFSESDQEPPPVYTSFHAEQIKHKAHLLMLRHQDSMSSKYGGWVSGEVEDIEQNLDNNHGDNALAAAFVEFTQGKSVAEWKSGLAVTNQVIAAFGRKVG